MNTDIVCLTETKLDPSIPSNLIFPNSEKCVYRKDRNINGGGVLIAIKKNIKHSLIKFSSTDEIVGITLPPSYPNFKTTVLACIYKKPGSLIDDKLTCFDEIENKFRNANILMMGDFNMPDINWESCSVVNSSQKKCAHQDFLNQLYEFSLTQLVRVPTHVHGNTLDLLCTNIPNQITDIEVVNPGLSDHYLLLFVFDTFVKELSVDELEIKLYKKADFAAIDSLLITTLSTVSAMIAQSVNINEIWSTFENDLKKAINSFVPTKHIKIKPRKEPVWFNNQARKAVSKQRKLYSIYKSTKTSQALIDYKCSRKLGKRLFRSLELEYMNQKLYNPLIAGNSKAFYKYIKNLKGSQSFITDVKTENDNHTENLTDIANILNNYFVSVFNKDTEKVDNIVNNHSLTINPCFTITREGVKQLLVSLKDGKASGPDLLSKADLTISTYVVDLLTAIYGYSVKIGQLPDRWKEGLITPIHKKGSKSEACNYRPISLTCLSCKMLEHIMLHYLNMYLDKVLYNNQHGFRKSLSCNTQLLNTVHVIQKFIDQGSCVQTVALDFSKAFDKVSHSLLIKKLIAYNIPCQLVKWIASFLSNRTQRVVIKGHTSTAKLVTSGVPQGSVLGPSLFLLYINDIVEEVTCDIRLFADDALIYSVLSDRTSITEFQHNLDNLQHWSNKWNMQFNTDKCSVMFFGSSPLIVNTHYTLCGNVLQVVDHIKYLGVTISNTLKWEKHINNTLTKAWKILGLIKASLWNAPIKVKKVAYLTLCRPILEYASDVWDPFLKKDIHKIEMLQNKAIRFILNLRGICSISEAKADLKIDSLESRRYASRTRSLANIMSHPEYHGALFDDLSSMFSLTDAEHVHVTRSISNSLPRSVTTNTNLFYNSFLPRTARELRLS